MVGFDDALNEVLESLMGNQQDLQIIPITGMGGIGKTTLARNLFENACVKEHFDVRAWTTISQDYNAQQVLKELLSQTKGHSSGESESELGLELYQYLWARRYLIVMDDMRRIEVWGKISCHFPNCNDGSRIIVTSRLSSLASHFNNGFNMKFLDNIDCWNLFSKIVFSVESFSLELEEIGKKIGLPLSIVTIGGLLAKSEQTCEYWEHIDRNLISIVNLEDDEYCFRILKMSYNYFPVHLKPCFLYMGLFKEDLEIEVSTLINLWISEGFIEQIGDKCLETIAEENLKDLVDRNLILLDLSSSADECCKIHDLLSDMCIREAEKCGFYYYAQEHIPQDINSMYRINIHQGISYEKLFLEALQSTMSGAISVLHHYGIGDKIMYPFKLRLLRAMITSGEDNFLDRNLFELANMRYLFLMYDDARYISSLNLLWNLHTLIIHGYGCFIAPIEIWNMPYLRQVEFHNGVYLPDPPTDHEVIMKNLHTLKEVCNLKLSQEVVKRIPNSKTLDVGYLEIKPHEEYFYLNYLECLHKLASFRCSSNIMKTHDFMKKLTFPQSLKKLRLDFNKGFELEEMLEKIGALPLLRYLFVKGGFFRTREWRTVESQLCRLQSLHLQNCRGLERWTLESSHFPRLEEIHLEYSEELEQISSEIGDIPTLQRILVSGCKMPAVMCLKKIVEEQEEFQGEEQLSFKVNVRIRKSELGWEEVLCSESTCWNKSEPHFHSVVVKEEAEVVERLKGPNFHILIDPRLDSAKDW